ncbi:unnamed protein product, partial [Allacma fusca]
CALHWMLSHSLNATLRDDEERDQPQYNKGYLRAKRETGKQRSLLNDSDYEEIEKDEDLQDYESNPASQLGGAPSDLAALKDGRIENLPSDAEVQNDKEHYDPTGGKSER